MSDAVSPAALNRLQSQALSEHESAARQLAYAPFLGGGQNPSAQDVHPSAQRLASSAWAGKTGQMNNAQAAQDRADIWVTVPVDKIITKGNSASAVPVYASPTGYVPRPGESAGSIPPTIPTTRPY
jgi:hypothetical protein